MQLTSLLHKASHAPAFACALLMGASLISASLMGASALRAASPAPAKRFKVAAVAFDPAWGDLDGNISRMVAGLEDVARQGVRLAVLPEIAMLFEGLKDAAEGMAKARIDSAFPLSDAQLAEITAALEKHFGKKIEASVNIEPSLIGGARITVGDTVIDGSVQSKLQAMAIQLRA